MDKEKKITRKIFFKEIDIPCMIGVYEHEKKHPQRIIINIELELSSEVEPTNDRIDETLNYDLIYREIKKISSSQHFNLVETLTYRIFVYLKKLKKVSNLRISVAKPDIYDDCNKVGYEISTF
jgi:dihydroneopterin aldolase